MKKRLFSILMALTLCLTLLPTAALAEGGALRGAGTRKHPYLIQNQEDLLAFADIVNGTNGAVQNTAACAIVIKSFVVSMNDSWTPMGSEDAPYTGTFICAEDVEISDLYIYKKTSNQIGLFGYIKNAVIDNVSLVDAMITGDTDVGGIAGVAVNSMIKNCTVSGTPVPGPDGETSKYSWGVRGSESVGGIVGRLEDSCVKDCTNKAAVYLIMTGEEPARHKLGGIAGVATLSRKGAFPILIDGCTNEGKVTCTTMENYECTGGIVGRLVSDNARNRAVVRGCKNQGVVSSIEAGTGGIVGYAQNASVENCTNSASVTGTTGVGGIAGYAYYGTQIVSCENSGSVEGKKYNSVEGSAYNIGGIVGSVYNPRNTSHEEGDCDSFPVYSYNRDSLISNCTNSGAVTCNDSYKEGVPKIRYYRDVPVAVNIYEGGSFTGGIAGFAMDSAYFDEEGNAVRIENCTNHGTVTGAAEDGNATYTGGILGIGKNALVNGCKNKGTVTNADAAENDTVRNEIGGNSYTIRFDANGGTLKTEETLALAGFGVLEKLPEPTRDGSGSFVGWFTTKRGGDPVTTETVYTRSTTLYARWSNDFGDDIPFVPSYTPSVTPTYPITTGKPENGAVTAASSAARGDTVIITVTPDKGYTLESLSVLDRNGGEIELTDLGGGRYSFTMPAGKVTVAAVFMEDNAILNAFVDVPVNSFYYDAVLWAVGNGLTTGVDDLHFGPNGTCSRAQLVTFLWRAAGCPVVNYAMNFDDVAEGLWYSEAIRWAASEKIVGGYGDGLFGTGDSVTREQAATILYRFAVAMGMDVSVGEDTNILSYNDAQSIPEYAVAAFQWACGAGVVQGSEGYLMPATGCDRAQIVTMLYRLLGE